MPSLYICMGCLGEKFCVITAGLFLKLDICGGGQGTKCHTGNETEAGEDGRC